MRITLFEQLQLQFQAPKVKGNVKNIAFVTKTQIFTSYSASPVDWQKLQFTAKPVHFVITLYGPNVTLYTKMYFLLIYVLGLLFLIHYKCFIPLFLKYIVPNKKTECQTQKYSNLFKQVKDGEAEKNSDLISHSHHS